MRIKCSILKFSSNTFLLVNSVFYLLTGCVWNEGSPRVKVRHLIEAMQTNGPKLQDGTMKNNFAVQTKKARVAVLISGTGEVSFPLYWITVEMLFPSSDSLPTSPSPPEKNLQIVRTLSSVGWGDHWGGLSVFLLFSGIWDSS